MVKRSLITWSGVYGGYYHPGSIWYERIGESVYAINALFTLVLSSASAHEEWFRSRRDYLLVLLPKSRWVQTVCVVRLHDALSALRGYEYPFPWQTLLLEQEFFFRVRSSVHTPSRPQNERRGRVYIALGVAPPRS